MYLPPTYKQQKKKKRGGSKSQQKMNNIQREVGCIKKGWVRKSIKDKYPTAMSKRGRSESQQKMNIQQDVGHVKKVHTLVDLIDIHVFLVKSQLTFLILPFF